jgi:drug/metabolite transporter (DMT)-like permease
MDLTYVYGAALGANLFFSTASMVFSHYAQKHSPFWINQVKVSISFPAFAIAAYFVGFSSLSWSSLAFLLASGLAGLCIGDLFLFRAYATLGAARSLVLFSFQPLLLGLYGWFFLNQGLGSNQFFAITCMLICLFIFVLERNKMTGRWELKSFLWAFIGICLDAFGVMMTRQAYELSPHLESMQVNMIRAGAAFVGFLVLQPTSLGKILKDFKHFHPKESALLFIASLCGTFLSLSLYLFAVKHAHVATLTAMAITGPVWVSLLECVWHRKLPNVYLVSAFLFFILGFSFMVK